MSASRGLDQAQATLRGQTRRLEALEPPPSDPPAAPDAPGREADGFGPDGDPLVDCEREDEVADALAAATFGLAGFRDRVDAFSEAVEAREALVIALEDAAASTTPAPTPTDPERTAEAPDEGAAGSAAAEPLKVDGNDLVFQRVLTLPDARIVPEAGAEDGGAEPAPPFSVLYVYERAEVGGRAWLGVGPGVAGERAGWIDAERTLEWNSALVMQFAPVGRRKRALFFESSRDLVDLIADFQFVSEAGELYEQLDRGALEDRRIIAAEPATAVQYDSEPYLLPILDHLEERFDDGSAVTLVKVASVSLKTGELAARDAKSLAPQEETQRSLKDFRIGLTFVMDTTASMGPYIRRTHETVRAIYEALAGLEASISIGLVAYRDNTSHDAGVGYVTEVIQPLDPGANPRSVVANIGSVRPSKAPTVDWREDAYAGIAEAMERFDWNPYDLKLMFLITDAGAREGGDALAARQDLTTSVLAEAARLNKIAIVPIHLITPEAQKLGEVAGAARQYSELGLTGDANSQKYLAVDATSDAAFIREVRDAASLIVEDIRRMQAEEQAQQAPLDPSRNDGFLKSDGLQGGGEAGPRSRLAGLVANELLRAKLEYLGERDAAAAPSFISGWAANRDLTDPSRATLTFSVFLTRNQVSALAQGVELLVDAFRSAGTSPDAFFDELQLIAARTARDPEQVRADERAAVREILPSFVQGLPYLSEVLRLDRPLWRSFSNADKQRFVEALEGKLAFYRRLYDQTENWVDFGAGDPALESYPLPLSQLP